MNRIVLLIALALAQPVAADTFRQVTSRSSFVDLVNDRDLTRLGVRLNVTADGGIDGRAFGRDVDGRWVWRDGYFCREISAGSYKLPMNCQAVLLAGRTLRFVSDQGRGDSADLRLD